MDQTRHRHDGLRDEDGVKPALGTSVEPVPGAGSRSPIVFPPELPVSARVADLSAAISEHQVVIVAGATGSGKTTQLPKVALQLGRGTQGFIGVTQPRRIAATSVAARVATELQCALGEEVGYQIRFEDRTSQRTYVKFMTDGILLAEIQNDRLLRRYDTLILDEAHERSLTIDFLMGWLRQILPQRPDLKIVIASATIETDRFSEFFRKAPVITVEGRTYPVEVLYEPPAEELDLSEAVAQAVELVSGVDPRGDVLVFLPGEREIREAEQELLTRNLRHTQILPLYARLSAQDQRKVFVTGTQRRVILATNVAETSITLPNIVSVVDAGLARLSRYDPRTGTTRLGIEQISQASADQRKGRCGRVRDGVCIRLYDEMNFAARPAYTDPEIRRTSLATVILRMKALSLGEVEDFPFLDPPHSRAIAEGYRVLQELGALDDERNLTELGRKLAHFPVDPRLARMILAGAERGCLDEVLVVVAGLNIQDPRERPRGLETKADAQHLRFRDERSDFVGLLKLWDFLKQTESRGKGQLRRACKDGFLAYLRVREWFEVHRQLEDVVRELRLRNERRSPQSPKQIATDTQHDALHLALLSGLLARVGQWNPESRVYFGARQTRFALHPSSALARRPPAWVMAFELVETTQLFARSAAKIEPEWLDMVGGHLLKRSYSDPHWSEKSARAVIKENATLFGLPVFRGRTVDYANVAPVRARLMFLEHALVRGEYQSKGSFQEHNKKLLAEVSRLRAKARKSDMLADDDALLNFFDQRVAESVVSGKTFEAFRERAEKSKPELLQLTLGDVLAHDAGFAAEDFPDTLELAGQRLPLSYRFDPSADDDGITLSLPLLLLPQVEKGVLDWTVRGFLQEKLAFLLRDLPRAQRSALEGSLDELAASVSARLEPFNGPFLPQLSQALSATTSVRIPESALRLDALPPYLRLNVSIVDERGKALGQSRDTDSLFERYLPQARELHQRLSPPSDLERQGLTGWSFGALPQSVERRVGALTLRSYPALQDRGSSVDLRLLESAEDAQRVSIAGVRRLLLIASRRELETYTSRLPQPFARLDRRPHPRSVQAAFQARVLEQVADCAFELESTDLPRDKAEFERRLSSGSTRFKACFTEIAELFRGVGNELDETLRLLDKAGKQPSGRAALVDIQKQLDLLLPEDVAALPQRGRLQNYPRYLRAARLRLERALTDPRKDADKLQPFTPVWTSFLAKLPSARNQRLAQDLRYAFEELRVAIFAPELRAAPAVSVSALAAAVAALE